MKVPGWVWRHDVTIERYLGDSAYGPTYADAVTIKGLVEQRRRVVRDSTGREVVSETTVFLPAGTADVPPDSRITASGRTSTVLTSSNRDGSGLPTPDHLELTLK